MSSYYWGYLISQIPAGRISEVFSAKWVMFSAVVINIICTLLTPVAAQIEPLLMFLRCVEGVGGGFSFPAMHSLLSKWAPVEERSTITTIVCCTWDGFVCAILWLYIYVAELGSSVLLDGKLACYLVFALGMVGGR